MGIDYVMNAEGRFQLKVRLIFVHVDKYCYSPPSLQNTTHYHLSHPQCTRESTKTLQHLCPQIVVIS